MIIARFFRVGAVVLGHAAWLGLVRIGWLVPRTPPAQKFARTLEKLGTTFIKLGQGLSLYPDLLPEDYIQALQNLQENVAPFDGQLAAQKVACVFQRPLSELFSWFDPVPLAAASIAQVHAARLLDGREVVVKIRRPGIPTEVAQDMRILRAVLGLFLPFFPALQAQDPLGIIDEIEGNLRQEMDFRREARHVRQFEAMFRDSPAILIPSVADDLYAESVMVQVRVSGKRVDHPSLRPEGPTLSQNLVDAYLVQLFAYGVFHADPHPGNLLVTDDNQIAFLDFGLVSTLTPETRRLLAAYMQAFVLRDADWLMETYLAMGVIGGNVDREAFRRGLQNLVNDYASLPLSEWSFAEAFLDILRMGQGQNVTLPRNLVILDRALFLVEGAIRALDPTFNLVDGLLSRRETMTQWATQPLSREAQDARFQFELLALWNDLPRSVTENLHRIRTGQVEPRVHLVQDGDERRKIWQDRRQNRLSLAIITTMACLTSTWLLALGVGPKLWDIPLVPVLGYLLATRWLLRILAAITHSGDL